MWRVNTNIHRRSCMVYRRNIAAGVVLSLFAAFVLQQSFFIRIFRGIGMPPLDATAIPRMWGGALLILSVNLMIRGLRQRYVFLKSGQKAPVLTFNFVNFFQKNYPVILTFVMIAVFIAFLESVGFIIMSSLYMFGQILVLSPLGRKKYIFSALLSIGVAVLLNYVFVVPLGVLLPRGILGF